MRLYLIGPLWRGTEAEAKAAARETGGDWQKVEVPTDKPGLLTFLNERLEAERVASSAATPADAAKPVKPGKCPVCDRTESAAAFVAQSEDLQAINDFILDRATPMQVENIFSAIGARFHELRKAAEAAR